MRIQVSWKKAKYDKRNDVLHVFLGNMQNSCAEEEYPGVYISKDDDTEEIVGLTIMDFQKRRVEVEKLLLEYEFALT